MREDLAYQSCSEHFVLALTEEIVRVSCLEPCKPDTQQAAFL